MADLFERSPWSQLGSNITRDRLIRGTSIRQTHTKGFHPTDPYGVSIRVTTSQRDPILPAVCTYMKTRIHTHHTCLHICELVGCSGIWRRKQKREGEEDRDREWRWLINDYIHMYSILLYAPVSPPLLSSKPNPHAYVYICRNTGHLYIYIHIHVYAYIYTYTYTCIRPRTCTHAYVRIHSYIRIYMMWKMFINNRKS